MIAWASQLSTTNFFISAQSFTNFGVKIGNSFRVNTYIINDQSYPSIETLANDNYIVTWQSNNQDGNAYGIYSQILDSSGNKIGTEFRLNSYTKDNQMYPSIASLINTNFVAVWQSNYQDGSVFGIFGNIYQSNGSTIVFKTCPLNCQLCDNKANCITCDPNFKVAVNGLCECFDGFYLNNNICLSMLIISIYFI